jgi:hypothetical protein
MTEMMKIRSKKIRFGHWKLGIGIYLGFGICDLGFETMKFPVLWQIH